MRAAWFGLLSLSVIGAAFAACSRTPEPTATTAPSAISTVTPSAAPTGAPPVTQTTAPLAASATSAPSGLPKTLEWTAPKAWATAPNPNSFRKATYKIPGAAKDAEAELAISESGGSLADNIARWEKQFSGAKATTQTKKIGPLSVTLVELRGTYTNSMGMGTAAPLTKAVLLGAIVNTETPHFFKLTGPEKTVDAAKPAWEEFLKSLRPGAS